MNHYQGVSLFEFDCQDETQRLSMVEKFTEMLLLGGNRIETPLVEVENVLRSLPPLLGIFLAADIGADISMYGLGKVLSHSCAHLVKFDFRKSPIKLRGSHQDYLLLLQAIQQLSKVQTFMWGHRDYGSRVRGFPGLEETFPISSDALVHAIVEAGAPLRELMLPGKLSDPTKLQELVARVEATLTLFLVALDGSTVKVVSQQLMNVNCRIIFLGVNLRCLSGINSFMDAVVKSPRLHVVLLTIDLEEGRDNPAEMMYPVEQACLTAANALTTNTAIHFLRLDVQVCPFLVDSPAYQRITDAFVETLQHNTSLQYLDLDTPGDPPLPPILDYYLQLNKLGRKRIIEKGEMMTREQWVAELAKHPNHHDWLFFVLQSNPSLCCHLPEDIAFGVY